MSTDKRKADEDSTVGSDAEDYGPSLSEMNQLPKKRKGDIWRAIICLKNKSS